VCFKFWGDQNLVCNESFSRIAGISIQKINQIELRLLETMNYSLFLTEAEILMFTKDFVRSSVDPYIDSIVGSPKQIQFESPLELWGSQLTTAEVEV